MRENNQPLNKTVTYEYDGSGNILNKKEYAYTTSSTLTTPTSTITYGYGNENWKNQLTSYNGQSIVYDSLGNPTNYLGKTLRWEGRQLASYSGNPYTYGSDGLRETKRVGNQTTTFEYNETQLIHEQRGSRDLYYSYDESGNLVKININQTTDYYVTTNTRGDVEAIYDEDGDLAARYIYDSWGKVIHVLDANDTEITETTHIGHINPIRYRGYYYDAESGFYYLQSRYYDPEVGRFINADGEISGVGGEVLGYNLYSYRMNNPINMGDPTGNWPEWVTSIGNVVKNLINKIVNKVQSVVSSVKSSILYTAKVKPDSLPLTGQPDSSQTLYNPDGSPKQKRWYGSDGSPVRDRDYNHAGNMPFPHDYVWDSGRRNKEHLPPSPDYEFSLEPLLGAALVGVCTIGIATVVLNDLTGIGVADNSLMVPLSAGVEKGLLMIFP